MKVVGIRFKKAGKIYYFNPLNFNLKQHDHVVVQTIQGIEYGEVALAPKEVEQPPFGTLIRPVLRKATYHDEQDYLNLRKKEQESREIFERKVQENKLNMRLIRVEYTFDKRKAIFYFSADGRVDFRNLVRDLAAECHVRIELRQVGSRDEAKIFRTLGICGRTTCCAKWIGDFVPVSVKMAKLQGLAINSSKISGICGRLLCCLNYENDFYQEVSKKMPKVGATVETPDGIAQVTRLNVLGESVMTRRTNEKDEIEIGSYPVSEISVVPSGQVPVDKAASVLKSTDPRKTVLQRKVTSPEKVSVEAEVPQTRKEQVKKRRNSKRKNNDATIDKGKETPFKKAVKGHKNEIHPNPNKPKMPLAVADTDQTQSDHKVKQFKASAKSREMTGKNPNFQPMKSQSAQWKKNRNHKKKSKSTQ